MQLPAKQIERGATASSCLRVIILCMPCCLLQQRTASIHLESRLALEFSSVQFSSVEVALLGSAGACWAPLSDLLGWEVQVPSNHSS